MIQSIRDILLVADMDGTLLTDDKTLLSCNLEALRLFTSMGGRFTVATGRVYASVAQYPELQPFMVPCITSGGSVIYDFASRQVLRTAILPRLTARRAFEDFRRAFPRAGVHIEGSDGTVYQAVGSAVLQGLFDDEGYTYKVCPDDALPEDWNKILFAAPPEQMPQLQEFAATHQYPGASFVLTQPMYLEMMPEGVSKGAALRELCAILEVPLEHTVVIGDYYNDLDMMAVAGRAIAMADAPPEVIEAAGETTLSSNDGGVGHAVYNLIREYGG